MDFQHSEYIKDIRSTTDFQVEHLDIIPTNTALFPLLSQFANNFEKYRFNHLVFYYRTKTSSSSSTSITSLGTVIYCIKYDPTLPNFTSKNEMQNYQGARTCRTDNDLQIKCYLPQKFLYNRPGGLSRPTISVAGVSASDIRNEVIGKLAIATAQQGLASIPIGELWVDYNVSFQKAKLYQTLGGSNRGAKMQSLSNAPGLTTPANVLGGFFSSPTQTSVYWDELNVTFPGATAIQFDAIDGAVIEVQLQYNGLGTTLFDAANPLTMAMSPVTMTWALNAGSHSVIFHEIENNLPQNVVSTPPAPASNNPRTVNDPDGTGSSWLMDTANVSRFGAYELVPATAGQNHIPSPYIAFFRHMAIKCRGTERITINCNTAQVTMPYQNVMLSIMVLDRPNMFPQNTTTSVLNPNWFQP